MFLVRWHRQINKKLLAVSSDKAQMIIMKSVFDYLRHIVIPKTVLSRSKIRLQVKDTKLTVFWLI